MCGIRTERVAFADPKARITKRLRQVIGLDCQSMATSHAAVRHGVSWSKARRAEGVSRRVGLHQTEVQATTPRGERDPSGQNTEVLYRALGSRTRRGDRLSERPHGSQLDGLAEHLPRFAATAAVKAVCTDMHQPYLNAVSEVLKEGRNRLRQIPCPAARLRRARRGPPAGVLSGGRRDACLWAR
jgi:transposase